MGFFMNAQQFAGVQNQTIRSFARPLVVWKLFGVNKETGFGRQPIISFMVCLTSRWKKNIGLSFILYYGTGFFFIFLTDSGILMPWYCDLFFSSIQHNIWCVFIFHPMHLFQCYSPKNRRQFCAIVETVVFCDQSIICIILRNAACASALLWHQWKLTNLRLSFCKIRFFFFFLCWPLLKLWSWWSNHKT